MNRFATRILATVPALLSCGLAFAEDAEVPMETAGVGGIIAFLVACIAMGVAFVWYTNKSSKMSDTERSGDKLK